MTEEGPDGLERGIRLGCGSLFGLVVGIVIAFRFMVCVESGWIFVVLVIASVALSALLALKYGDRFWEEAFKYLREWI